MVPTRLFLLLFVGCAGASAHATTVVPPRRAPAAVVPAAVAHDDRLAWARAIGDVVASIDVPVAEDVPAHQIAFILAHGAVRPWRLARGEVAVALPDWPAAADVRRVFLHEGRAFAEVESRALFDQPSGLVGFVDVEDASTTRSDAACAEAAARWQGAKSSVEFMDRKVDDAAALSTIAAARTSLGSLASAAGVDVWRLHQGIFLERIDHVDAKRQRDLVPLLHAATNAPYCDDCEDRGPTVIMGRENDKTLIRGIVTFTRAVNHRPSSAPSFVSATSAPEVTRAGLVRLGRAGAAVAEAPFDRTHADSTIGLAMLRTDDRDVPSLIVHEGTDDLVAGLDDLAGTSFDDETNVRYAARFLDVDGDGRTEVLVERTIDRNGHDVTSRHLYRVDATLASPATYRGRIGAFTDTSRLLEVHLASSIDAAAVAARAHVSAHVKASEICAIVQGIETLQGLRSKAKKGAMLLRFAEPSFVTFDATATPVADVTDWSPSFLDDPSVPPCDRFACDGDSYCAAWIGPGSTHLWFQRVGGKLVLSGVADYSGS